MDDYDFSPPFTDAAGMIRFIRGTLNRGKDMMIANEGGEGSGKSTTGANLARHIKPDFDLRRDTIKDLDHLLQVMHEAKKRQLYVLDESINIFHNQDWAKWESKDLSKLIRQMRIMESVWILNQPDFDGLHPYVREVRIPLRIYHPDKWDSDGMSNGPSQVFWRFRYFNVREQRVVHRWSRVIDELHVPALDETAEWQGYEEDKVENFRRLVGAMRTRRQAEAKKEAKAVAKNGVARRTPPLRSRGGPSEVEVAT